MAKKPNEKAAQETETTTAADAQAGKPGETGGAGDQADASSNDAAGGGGDTGGGTGADLTSPPAELAAQAKPKAGAKGKTAGGITITAKPKGGFRRAGRHHPAEAVTWPAGTFDDEQIEVLKGEPNLIVVEN